MDEATKQMLVDNFWYIIGGTWVFGGIIVWLLPKKARLFKQVLAMLVSAVTTFLIYEKSGVAVFWQGMSVILIILGGVFVFAIVYGIFALLSGTHAHDK